MRRPKPAAYELLKLEASKVYPRVKKTLLAREIEVYAALKKLRDICKANKGDGCAYLIQPVFEREQ